MITLSVGEPESSGLAEVWRNVGTAFESELYKVVVNYEAQYSIWPADRDCPNGWKEVGTVGPKSICLAFIEEVWSDMRPLSVRIVEDSRDAE